MKEAHGQLTTVSGVADEVEVFAYALLAPSHVLELINNLIISCGI